MKIHKACGAALAVMFFFGPAVFAQQRICGDEPVTVKAVVGQAVEIEVENGVADLVRSGDPALLKVEHTAGHLFVTPLSREPAGLTVIDVSGRSHRLKYVFDQGLDEKIIIGDCEEKTKEISREDIAMSLMRDLVSGHVPEGASSQNSDAVMLDNGRVRLRCTSIYELPQVLGYAMVMENITLSPVVVPLQQIAFPGLMALSSEKDLLAQGEKTRVYMVVRR